MALPSSGPLSINDIAVEFGGSAPHSLSEYYGVATGIPASGTIAIDDFYGAAAVTYLYDQTDNIYIDTTDPVGRREIKFQDSLSSTTLFLDGQTRTIVNLEWKENRGTIVLKIRDTGTNAAADNSFGSLFINGFEYTEASAAYSVSNAQTGANWTWAVTGIPNGVVFVNGASHRIQISEA